MLRQRRSSRRSRSATSHGSGVRSRRRPCVRGRRRWREPASGRIPDAWRACSCVHDVRDHRRDRTHPGCHHACCDQQVRHRCAADRSRHRRRGATGSTATGSATATGCRPDEPWQPPGAPRPGAPPGPPRPPPGPPRAWSRLVGGPPRPDWRGIIAGLGRGMPGTAGAALHHLRVPRGTRGALHALRR